MAQVPPFLLEFSEGEIQDIHAGVEDVLRSGWLSLGKYTEQLELEFGKATKRNYAVACNSGSSALEIIFKSIPVRGRTVLVPTNTNFATAAAAKYAGAAIKFYDSGLYPVIEDLQRQLSPSVAAVAVVHIGGYISPNMDEIVALCSEHDIPVVEDAAHAHGAVLGGRPAGSLGHAAAFSFFPSKVITTGEGGIVVTNDERISRLAVRLRNQGMSEDGDLHDLPGGSWRITELGAVVGLVQLKRLFEDAERRIDVLKTYRIQLGDVPGIDVPLLLPTQRPSGYKAVAMLTERGNRRNLRDFLRARQIVLAKEVYKIPLHAQPIFQDDVGSGIFPNAQQFCDSHICLPLWRSISNEVVDDVIGAIRDFFGQ